MVSERPCWCGQIHDTKYPDEHGFACPHRQPGKMECGVGVEGWDRCSHYTTQWFGDDGYYQFLDPGQCWIHERAAREAVEAKVKALMDVILDVGESLSYMNYACDRGSRRGARPKSCESCGECEAATMHAIVEPIILKRFPALAKMRANVKGGNEGSPQSTGRGGVW